MKPFLLAAALLALRTPAFAVKIERVSGTSPATGAAAVVEVVAERLLVKFSDSASAAQRTAAAAAVNGQFGPALSRPGWIVVNLPVGASVVPALQIMPTLPGVENVQADHIYRPLKLPNDPSVSQQYGLNQINAFGAWELETGSSFETTIAVIDSGVQTGHPEFSGKIAGPSQFFDPNAGGAQSADAAGPACNHGTRVAGIAAAAGDNALGVAGVSWGAKILSLRIFAIGDCNPTGNCPTTCTTSDAAMSEAIDYAVGLRGGAGVGNVIINLSVGGAGGCPGSCPGINCIALTQASLAAAAAAGVPVVVSAGNDGGAVNSPANCATAVGGAGIIPVGATDSANNVASFSSRGAELAANGVVAPGVNVFTTDIGTGYTAGATGTSFSAPHVAGLGALLLSARRAACTNLACAQDIQSKIRAGADGIGVSALGAPSGGYSTLGNSAGAGRVNAFKSVRLAVRGTLSDFEGQQKVVAFPNPFKVSDTGTMSFALPPALQGANAKIKIFTIAGELVKELVGLAWDGRNTAGSLVASGTYIFYVTTSAGKSKGRFAVVR